MPRKNRAFGVWYSSRAKGGSTRRKVKIRVAARKRSAGSKYATRHPRATAS